MTKRFTLLLAVAGTATGLFFVAPLAKGDDDKANLPGHLEVGDRQVG